MRVGLIGLGVMGWRIGVNLARAGKLHAVYNRTLSKAQQFSMEYGVTYAKSPRELAEGSDVILTVLSDDAAVKGIVEEILPTMKGRTLLEMSTISPSLSVELAERVSRTGGRMYDAPLVGTDRKSVV